VTQSAIPLKSIAGALRPTPGDILVALLTLVLLAGLYSHYWSGIGGEGERARIVSADGEVHLVALNEDRTLTVHGPLGDSVIEIHQGRVRFVESPCQGKQCIHAGWLHSAGSFAACLPNRISITVLGKNRHFDSINY